MPTWVVKGKFSLFSFKSHDPSGFHQVGYFLLGLAPKFAVRSTKYCGLIIIYYLFISFLGTKDIFFQMTSMSSNDDTESSVNHNFFAVRFTGPRPARLPLPLGCS